mgnify:CR=1 FL=1
MMRTLNIGNRAVGKNEPTYFIADVGANHDGDIGRAKQLIHLAAESGADAAKFQNFQAPKIVSKYGFEAMGAQLDHQASWKKSVYETYADASLPWEWTETLKAECDAVGIEYFSSPYDEEAVDMLDPFVNAHKIGSGDITWMEILRKISSTDKVVILSTGGSNILDVQRAVHEILSVNSKLILLQCNTNYTGNITNLKHVHLNVLKTYEVMFPDVILGLSDHTPGHASVLGAVALGGTVIEKHFTDDTNRDGPDHPFSMTPVTWRDMVNRTRELEHALGSADKRVADNEKDTVVVQRRCIRVAGPLDRGVVLEREHLTVLRPAPSDAISPYEIEKVVGMRLNTQLPEGEALRWDMLER